MVRSPSALSEAVTMAFDAKGTHTPGEAQRYVKGEKVKGHPVDSGY